MVKMSKDISSNTQSFLENELGIIKAMFAQSNNGIAITDLQGNLVDINKKLAEIHGYTTEELIGENISIFHNEKQLADAIRIHETMLETGRCDNQELWHVHRDGTEFPMMMNAIVVDYEGGNPKYIAATALDITERKLLEESLKESESKYSTLVEAGNDGIVILQDGLVKYVNPKMIEMSGFKIIDILEKPFINFVTADCKEVVFDRYKKRLAGEDVPNNYEIKIASMTGIMVFVEISASVIEYENRPADMAIVHDITEQKNSEAKLKESRNKLKTLYNSMAEGLCVHEMVYNDAGDAIDYKILDVNPSYEGILGLKKADVVNKLATEIYGIDEALYLDISANVVKTGESYKFESYFAPMGKYFSISVFYTGKDRFATLFSDITDRKKAEVKLLNLLNQSQQRENEVAELLNATTVILEKDDFQVVARHIFDSCARIIGAKAGYVALLSESGEENDLFFLEGGGMPCSVDPNLPMPVRGLRAEAYKTGKVVYDNDFMKSGWAEYMPEGHMILPNILFSPLKIGDKTVGIMGFSYKNGDFTDNDARLAKTFGEYASIALNNSRTFDALEKSNDLLENVITAIPELVWMKDVNGIYLTCNSRFERFFGAKREEIMGKSDYDFMSKETADFFTVKDRAAVAACKPTVNEEEITYVDDGHKTFLETIKTPIYNPDGSLIGVLGIGRDITDRTNFEKGLLESKIAAESANQTKSEFLANMSHELRTPLNSIIGFSQILTDKKYGELSEKQTKYASNVLNSGKHLLEVINSVLDISKVESKNMEYEPEVIDLSETIEEIKMMIEPLAKRKFISAKYENSVKNSDIFVDRVKFKSILYNLLSNAVKYTPANGEIRLYSEIIDGTLQISVSDNGIGIAKENHHLIFEPFKQAGSFMTREYGGTGLGLALAKNYVEMHNGTISVESEVGVGTTFCFTIPLHD